MQGSLLFYIWKNEDGDGWVPKRILPILIQSMMIFETLEQLFVKTFSFHEKRLWCLFLLEPNFFTKICFKVPKIVVCTFFNSKQSEIWNFLRGIVLVGDAIVFMFWIKQIILKERKCPGIPKPYFFAKTICWTWASTPLPH